MKLPEWLARFQSYCLKWQPTIYGQWQGVSSVELQVLEKQMFQLSGIAMPKSYREFLLEHGLGTGLPSIDNKTAPGAKRGSWHFKSVLDCYSELLAEKQRPLGKDEIFLDGIALFSMGAWIATQYGIIPNPPEGTSQKIWALCDYEAQFPIADSFPQYLMQIAFTDLCLRRHSTTTLLAPLLPSSLTDTPIVKPPNALTLCEFSSKQTLCLVASQGAVRVSLSERGLSQAEYWETESNQIESWLHRSGFQARISS